MKAAHQQILTQPQAQAIYSAMCALGDVHMRACRMEFGKAIVDSYRNGTIRVIGTVAVEDELHADQAAFAAAYGLNQ